MYKQNELSFDFVDCFTIAKTCDLQAFFHSERLSVDGLNSSFHSVNVMFFFLPLTDLIQCYIDNDTLHDSVHYVSRVFEANDFVLE